MKEEYLNAEHWSHALNEKFISELDDYFDEDKCIIVSEVCSHLIKDGNDSDLCFAETLLIYASAHYTKLDDSNPQALLYYNLGKLYEKKGFFDKAYTAYEHYTLNNTELEGNASVLVRALLLKDNCTYSDELDKELLRSFGEADLGLRTDRLYENIAIYIVALHDGDAERAEAAKKRIKAIIMADEIFVQDLFFRKDDIRDVIEVPNLIMEFAKSI